MVVMDQVSLDPSRVVDTCILILAIDIVSETILDSVLVACNSLDSAKLPVFETVLVVQFNLSILV